MLRYFLFFSFLISGLTELNAQELIVLGLVKDQQTGKGVENVLIRTVNYPSTSRSDRSGKFYLQLPEKKNYKLVFTHLAYQGLTWHIVSKSVDTLKLTITLKQKSIVLDSVSIEAKHKPETLVGKPNYSVFDFDFYEDKLLLLTSERHLTKARVELADVSGKIYSSFVLPRQAGEAKYFFHDYEGYTDLVCTDSVFRIDVMNNELMVFPIPKKDFSRYLKPVADSMNSNYYYSDAWDQYPLFNYYYLRKNDTASHLLATVTNTRLMDLYNFEYYFLPPHLQLEARRIEQYQKIDRHIAAALMSGFTQSLFYEALYAPLFIIKDTICIFNHHNDFLYHYNRDNQLIDSVKITYHHPKNWRDWKKHLIVDETENKVYALFSKSGHGYLRNVNYQTGEEKGNYILQHHSAEKIKIRDGYVYYVYRPFGSTQEKFLYREMIE
ncbi:MAG TPA: carboxypeptidase-like regulatory domain-containing protein [Bacteroidia bacterium]|nr:carboxypeptidase-like regulatory domain-containing protein [Bacteroidia bacterium]